ncbi:30S ribosome-binding factor RbfA [Ferrovibrio sp.]|uniref:30S ribosome-binding factor RbfA n=1 Tax=Ferrovibrio sp. TaxID=1917215 RepID=UPI003D141B4A
MTRRGKGTSFSGGARGGDAISSGRSQRQLRVGEEIRHVLSEALRRAHFRDPDLDGLIVTVTEVRVSPDLKNATAFVLPLAGDDGAKVVKGLTRAQAYIRTLVAQEINLRFAPTLSFKLDTSFDTAGRIDSVLHRPEVRADVEREPEAQADIDKASGDDKQS